MRRSNLIKLCILPIAGALLLTVAPQDAEAQLCKILKSKREGIKKKKCVVAGDVKNNSLTINQVRDVALSRRFFRAADFLFLKQPGLVIVTAAAQINATGSGGPVSVRCTVTPGKTARAGVPHTIVESLNPVEDVAFASIVATKVYKVRKGAFKVTFSCAQIAGSGAAIQIPGVSARYVPTKY